MDNKERAAKIAQIKNDKFNVFLSSISREEILQFYIEENHSYKELQEKLQVTGWNLDKILRAFDIHKTKQQSASKALITKHEKAGSKEQYDRQIKEKSDRTRVAKYGTIENYRAQLSAKCSKAWRDKSPEELRAFIQAHYDSYLNDVNKKEHAKKLREETLQERYGVDNAYKLAQYKCQSNINRDFATLLENNSIEYEQEFRLGDYRYDFHLLDSNILIEINPWPFHNSTLHPIEGNFPLDKFYHRNKTRCAVQQGYRVINIWDWDDVNKIIGLLKPRERLFARKCTIKEVDKSVAKAFIDKHHLQGYARDSIRIGLFYDDTLISIMTFDRPRYNKKYQYELIRYCSSYDVIGGAEKLFKYFINNHNPVSIISYCDLSKFTGATYLKLGMKEHKHTISKHWLNIKDRTHITDNLLRQQGFDRLFKKNYGKGTDNQQLMRDHGFVEIYDCGQASYIWNG